MRQCGDVVRRSPDRRFADHAALEEKPGVLQMLEAVRGARQHDVGRLVHLADDRLGGDLENPGTFTVMDGNEPHVAHRLRAVRRW